MLIKEYGKVVNVSILSAHLPIGKIDGIKSVDKSVDKKQYRN